MSLCSHGVATCLSLSPIAVCLSLSLMVVSCHSLSLSVLWSCCMSLTVSHCCLVSLAVPLVPWSCYMSFTVSYGCWLLGIVGVAEYVHRVLALYPGRLRGGASWPGYEANHVHDPLQCWAKMVYVLRLLLSNDTYMCFGTFFAPWVWSKGYIVCNQY